MRYNVIKPLSYLFASLTLLVINIGQAANMNADQPEIRLSGHIPSMAMAQARLIEPLAEEVSVPITFTLPLRNQKELDELIQRIYDPTDENYGKYLSSEEFIERFAPTQSDYDSVIAYAKNSGLEIIGMHPNRTLLNVKAKTSSIQTAFNVGLNVYQHSNKTFYAPDSEPEVPSNIASIISGIIGLDNSAVWSPHNRIAEIGLKNNNEINPASFPSGPGGGFAPNDIKKAYNLSGITLDGSGQSIALFQLGSYLASDINAYTTFFGLPAPNLTNVIVDGGTSTIIDEVAIDIELALAMAPKSKIYVYIGPNSGQGLLDTYNKIATDNLAKQVSSSWGLGEDQAGSQILQAENAIFQQMAAQGQTVYVASGDDGAYTDYPSTTPVVDDPSGQPYVTGVGGTSLTVDANTGNYVSETVWNNGLGNGASGGGVSTVWPIPSWQTNTPTTYSKTNRNVPDVALNANQYKPYSIYFNGSWVLYGGTSCSAPLWAGFTALVNQQRVATQKPVIGFLNPTFYALGNSQQATDYHDITSGNNYVYQAGPGYDNTTGWGSFNGANLFANLTSTSAATGIYINSGNGQVSDMCNSQITWQADQYFSGGTSFLNPNLPAFMGIYRSVRFGNFSYIVPVANGNYTVSLNFAEIYWTSSGKRVFNVKINGTQVLTNVDIYALAGFANPVHFSFPVNVINGSIKIDFITVVDNAIVNGISIN